MNLTELKINVNNGRFLIVNFTFAGEIRVRHFDSNGILDKETKISQGDFVSMLNWYYTQKENGNKDLLF